MHKILIPLIAVLGILSSCNDHPNDDGGVCTYVTDTIGATIIRMDSTGSPYPEIVLSVKNSNGNPDSLRYSNNTGESPTWEQCTERGYKVGVKLKCYHQLRTAGQCDPESFQVQKEVFK